MRRLVGLERSFAHRSHAYCGRASAYFAGEVDEEEFFDWRRSRPALFVAEPA